MGYNGFWCQSYGSNDTVIMTFDPISGSSYSLKEHWAPICELFQPSSLQRRPEQQHQQPYNRQTFNIWDVTGTGWEGSSIPRANIYHRLLQKQWRVRVFLKNSLVPEIISFPPAWLQFDSSSASLQAHIMWTVTSNQAVILGWLWINSQGANN